MTPQEFVATVLAAEVAELERRIAALADGETLCVHEHTWSTGYWMTRAVHVLPFPRQCAGGGRRTQYGPMTPEIRAAAAMAG